MKRTLIVKLGAMGDVLRTTPILRAFNGEVIWITRKESLPLLNDNVFITRVITPEKHEEIDNLDFDLVLNLDDEIEAASIASKTRTERLIGAYRNATGDIEYTEEASKWFDMGLISRHGLACANKLKKQNTRPYQEFLFEMLGLEFRTEEYVLMCPRGQNKDIKSRPVIGVEKRAGERWSLKKWDKYDELIRSLRKDGYYVRVFFHRNDVSDYIIDVNKCDVIITGDTLCMHIGIALGKQVIAIFGPTSADEIYDYGRVSKIVAPVDCVKCYKRKCDYNPSCMHSISVDDVYDRFRSIAKR